jgi:hypothetical protein
MSERESATQSGEDGRVVLNGKKGNLGAKQSTKMQEILQRGKPGWKERPGFASVNSTRIASTTPLFVNIIQDVMRDVKGESGKM